MATWCVNQYNDDLISFSADRSFFLMQYQYGYQNNNVVTLNWRRAQMIREGDWIVMFNKNKAYAIGKAIHSSVRHSTNQISNIGNSLANKAHLYSSGIVLYDDAEVFYENLSDSPSANLNDPWGQRIDVAGWLYFKGITHFASTQGISSHINVGACIDTIFGIDDDMFAKIHRNFI